MLTILFVILMLMLVGKLIIWSVKAAWGITKILFSILFCPLVLVSLFAIGLTYVAFPLLIIAGIIAFFGAVKA